VTKNKAPKDQEGEHNLTISRLGSAPQWAANIVIVFAFLGYMHLQSSRGDTVADQRIKTCHDVQERGVDVMDRLTSVLVEYQHDCRNMTEAFERLERALQDQTRSMEQLRWAFEERERDKYLKNTSQEISPK
jgi:hypothetical protein